VRGLTGQALNDTAFDPTCNIAGLTAGYQGAGMKTIIPARASAKVDFRLVPDQDPLDIFATLRAHLDAQGCQDVTLIQLGAMWPAMAAADDPLVQLTVRTGDAVYGLPTRVWPIVGGSTPIYAFAAPLGNISVVNPGVGYWDNRTHAPDEHVRLVDFHNAARHIARILTGFGDLGGQ
jgi:acetylornithine deacetylase/succinyl-diaminopimelate desuccinylase-like protein